MTRMICASSRFFRCLCILVLILGAVSAPAEGFHVAPHLQNITKDAGTVIWETSEPGPSIVEYGVNGSYDLKATDADNVKIHRVRLTGLSAETTYSYRVQTNGAEQSSTITTAPATEREITFVVFGDSRRWATRLADTKMIDHALQWKPEFFLNNGDLVGTGHKYELWPEHFTRFAPITDEYMMLTSRGNHEGSMLNDVENDWFGKYHELPGDGEPFASFDWGNTHFAMISFEQTGQAAEWLDKHLATVKSKYLIVTQHFPVYCTGYASPTDDRKEPGQGLSKLADVFDKYNVDINIAGHTHIYERTYPIRAGKRDDRNGITYVINGGDIRANYPDWWTAVGDDKESFTLPTYTVFFCKNDRIEFRTYCWSSEKNDIAEIDHNIVWSDEETPKKTLASLSGAQGGALLDAIEDLGAMLYEPAADSLLSYLAQSDAAVRQAAAKSISLIGSEAIAPKLIQHIKDEDLVVRWHIARALEAAMPESLAKQVAGESLDAAQDDKTRSLLIGALQFHAPEALTKKTMLDILRSTAPERVRERAAYALGRVTEKGDVKTLAKLFEKEQQGYVVSRLGFILNRLTGVTQNVNAAELSAAPSSKRKEYTSKWLNPAN